MNRFAILLILTSLCFYSPASADYGSERVESRIDRFELWNKCEPLGLVAETLSDDAAKIGLTREVVLKAVRSRLRAARLYSDQSPGNYFYVNITVVGKSFSVSIAYYKLVMDLASAEFFPAITWRRGITGMHGRSSSYILSSVSEGMDEFIDEYLRVNASACKS